MKEHLLRSREERMVGGVCAGLGSYLRIDPILVRIFFVILILADGVGMILYLLLWLIIPVEGAQSQADIRDTMRNGAEEISARAREIKGELQAGQAPMGSQMGVIVGSVLIMFGVFMFLDIMNLPWLAWFRLELLWPGLLILAGLLLLLRRSREE